jgi:hypothetical protein
LSEIGIPWIVVLKMDCEGRETPALRVTSVQSMGRIREVVLEYYSIRIALLDCYKLMVSKYAFPRRA